MKRSITTFVVVAATFFNVARSQVEYQHFDGFSVLSEPSFDYEPKSDERSFSEDILILEDTGSRGERDEIKDCTFVDANISITWETPDAVPVIYLYQQCGRKMAMTYRDVLGREWEQSKLVPLRGETLARTLSKLEPKPDLHQDAPAESRIANYAICKGVVPKPDWFTETCD